MFKNENMNNEDREGVILPILNKNNLMRDD